MQYRREGTGGDFAQGQSGGGGVIAESGYQTAREFDGEGNFDIADRDRVLELLGLFEIAIGLAPGDGTVPGEALGGLGQVFVFAQQGASQVEPLGFLGIAGAGHMTYKYASLCLKSRTLSSPSVLLRLSIRGHSLKLEVIFCVQAVISPLLANIYLHLLDRLWAKKCGSLGVLIRYADDFVVMAPTESKAKEALRQIQFVMSKLGLVLHPEKTRMVDLRRGKGSFVFLGCTIRKKRSILRNPRAYYMHRWPSPKATKRLRDRVREISGKRGSREDVKQIIAKLNPVLRGWGNYFRTGTCRREFPKMDDYVFARLTRWQHRRGSQRAQRRTRWTGAELYGMGLYQLRRTVRYAAQAAPVRSSLSRVRENRTHGLKGVC